MKITPQFISLDEAGRRHRIRKEIERYKQMVLNHQQVMTTVAERTAALLDLALEHGGFARRLREFRVIQIDLAKLSEMDDILTKNIDSFIIEHGYFVDQNA